MVKMAKIGNIIAKSGVKKISSNLVYHTFAMAMAMISTMIMTMTIGCTKNITNF